jgi:hypothetical protein
LLAVLLTFLSSALDITKFGPSQLSSAPLPVPSILYIRIAKTGSTTFVKRFEAWAQKAGRDIMSVSKLHGHFAEELRVPRNWQALHSEGESWDAFEGNLYYHKFMREPGLWKFPPVRVFASVSESV